MAKKHNLNPDEVLKHIEAQQQFLRSSISLFDNGDANEAKRIALAIRILVHETAKSRSLLKQAGLNHLEYFASGHAHDSKKINYLPSTYLVSIQMSSGEEGQSLEGNYAPLLDRCLSPAGWMTFNSWWNGIILTTAKNKRLFSRKELVLTIANQDGGAHVDPSIDAEYHAITQGQDYAWQTHVNGKFANFSGNIIFTSIRQVAFELLYSLERNNLKAVP